MAGAIKSIEEFYTSWNSPYRKKIEEHLQSKGVSGSINLPDIIGLINESLSNEITLIANQAVAQSLLPLVQKFLTREEKEIKFTDILKEFIKAVEPEDGFEECSCEITESTHGWLDCSLSSAKKTYELTLHQVHRSNKEEGPKKYQFLMLPRLKEAEGSYFASRTMTVKIDGASLEMPFTPDVLKDDFISFAARLCIGKSEITIDRTDFDEDMFEKDECHC